MRVVPSHNVMSFDFVDPFRMNYLIIDVLAIRPYVSSSAVTLVYEASTGKAITSVTWKNP